MRLDGSYNWRLLREGPALFMDLYELTMAQTYLARGMREKAYFEVTVRRLPENWGFFVMAGMAELEAYLKEFHFTGDEIKFLCSTKLFSDEFLNYLSNLKVDVKLRALPEGTVFFANEPALEVEGDLISAQILESYILNILGFSIITATVAARVILAAKGVAVVDFGLRRSQGPIASIRAARAAQMAGFKATSNLNAARLLDFASTGTMAHSFVEVYESEEKAFTDFAQIYGEKAIFLIDTYEPTDGIIKAAKIAAKLYKEKGIKVGGIRIDSGHLVKLSRFAREYFKEQGVGFLKIFVSGDLDEFKIVDLLAGGAEIDGIGIGTRFAVSRYAPSIDIVYKIVKYDDKELFKTSPDKPSRPGRKSIKRTLEKYYSKDVVLPFCGTCFQPVKTRPGWPCHDLLKPFETSEDMAAIQKRLKEELSRLDPAVKAITNPASYPVIFQ